jgi:S1-C subfamily serine protease
MPFVLGLLLALGARAPAAHADDAAVATARAARPSVVRVRWRPDRRRDVGAERNAVVIDADGLLLMAGPPPSRRGRLSAVLADGTEHEARILAFDAPTALTLLRVPTTGLRPLELREEAATARPSPEDPFAPRPLHLPPLGLQLVMVTGDGAVAMGPVRSHARYGSVTDPDTRATVRTTGLVGAALAAVDTDAGSPLLDADGRLAGLMVGRLATVSPARAAAARAGDLRARPQPVEVVAVPASVIAVAWPLLRKVGRVPRAALGITTEPVDAALCAHLGLEGGGHVVRKLQAGGVAVQADLRVHDVIVSINGLAVEPGRSMHDLLLPFRPGTDVRLGIVRGREKLTVTLKTGAR